MKLNPYLMFNGDCEEAFRFYERALGGKIVAMHAHEGSPGAEHLPAEWGKKIMHARDIHLPRNARQAKKLLYLGTEGERIA